jgi:predicted N-formylglutamate amidohydrolase
MTTIDDIDGAEILSVDAPAGVLLVCDHASNRVPAQLANLGLSAAELDQHIGWDIGAAALTRALSVRLDASAVLARYSRLVIDCNRAPDARDLVPLVSDGVAVPANAGLGAEDIALRLENYHEPYHRAIHRLLSDPARLVPRTAMVAVHSFTPRMNGQDRPWHLGLLFDDDARLAQALQAESAHEPGYVVGINQPYAPSDGIYYTLARHAAPLRMLNVMLEVRNDLLSRTQDIEHQADRLSRWLSAALTENSIRTG